MAARVDIYGGRDPRTLPAYTVTEASFYLRIPVSTVRSWVHGRQYTTIAGAKKFSRVIEPAQVSPCLLSFENLTELHVLRATRAKRVALPAIRHAVWYLRANFETEHPLSRHEMITDGVSLFVDYLGALVNVSRDGQLAIRAALEQHLDRVERSPDGVPLRLYPFGATKSKARVFSIDPEVKFGRMCITGTGITVEEVLSRYRAGESIESLAKDFGRAKREIREALKAAA